MSHVEVDDYECNACGITGIADLDMKTGVYTCQKCGEWKK